MMLSAVKNVVHLIMQSMIEEADLVIIHCVLHHSWVKTNWHKINVKLCWCQA